MRRLVFDYATLTGGAPDMNDPALAEPARCGTAIPLAARLRMTNLSFGSHSNAIHSAGAGRFGELIRLIVGDWNGQSIDAVFYNVTLRSACKMWDPSPRFGATSMRLRSTH
jgi:hypothetical protein